MTSLQGYITAAYDDLVQAFGQPTMGPDEPSMDEKVTCEWRFEIDGEPCTVYDWKEYTGVTPRGQYQWHIGGRTKSAERKVHEAFARPKTDAFAAYSDGELTIIAEAAHRVANFADDLDRDEFEDFYSLAMEIEHCLRLRNGK